MVCDGGWGFRFFSRFFFSRRAGAWGIGTYLDEIDKEW